MPEDYKSKLERELLRDMPTEFEEANSSLILRASYNPETQDCTIVLKAGPLEKPYLYGGMPAQVWMEFVQAESKGQYYNRFIRPMFQGRAL